MSALARMGERISVGPDLPAFAAMSEEIGTGLLFEEEAPDHYTTFVASRFTLCRLPGMNMPLPITAEINRTLRRHCQPGSAVDLLAVADAAIVLNAIPLPERSEAGM